MERSLIETHSAREAEAPAVALPLDQEAVEQCNPAASASALALMSKKLDLIIEALGIKQGDAE